MTQQAGSRARQAGSKAEQALTRALATGRTPDGTADHDALQDALDTAATGGKRVRPHLLTTVYEALGGTQPQVAAEVAAGVELLHTALVTHDDVVDGDTVRRGRPNVSGTFAARALADGADARRSARYGDAAGILVGDLALAGAVRTVALCGAEPAVVYRLLEALDRALCVTVAGELTDVRLALGGRHDVTEALRMAEHKTAVYSFQLPLELAALLAEAPEGVVDALSRYGALLGLAYQLRDDVDELYGDHGGTGKDPASDLREGRYTPLVAYARSTPAWPEIAPVVGDPTAGLAELERVRDLMIECGARQYVEDLVADLVREARETVAHLPVAPVLEQWADTVALVGRDA
ncbi:polyprenyl synthetase family protein [Puerhibacterium puerhi]|uniref:polyprenyl synthetase family protein n=1 Tax=Puerhibacterium puerhi TaxID=2692623 RepID=UPI001356B03A|nr:polyprenyl synthetase family protein [Puerhibacterium puerhi]